MNHIIATSVPYEVLSASAPLNEIEDFLRNSKNPYKIKLHSLAEDANSLILGLMYPADGETHSPGRSWVRKDSYFVRIAGKLEIKPVSEDALRILGVEI